MSRQIRALVILPVKELAMQVAKVFKDYCVGTNLKVALVTGSTPFQQEQMQLLRYGNRSKVFKKCHFNKNSTNSD
jgi:ATP-dependent RNA helicase DDX51/DBP6